MKSAKWQEGDRGSAALGRQGQSRQCGALSLVGALEMTTRSSWRGYLLFCFGSLPVLFLLFLSSSSTLPLTLRTLAHAAPKEPQPPPSSNASPSLAFESSQQPLWLPRRRIGRAGASGIAAANAQHDTVAEAQTPRKSRARLAAEPPIAMDCLSPTIAS